MVAQGAHAAMKVYFDRIAPGRSSLLEPPTGGEMDAEIVILTTRGMWDWTFGSFTKVVCRADSEEELVAIYEKAEEAGLPAALVIDQGRTEFHGVPTKTCCSIGPARVERFIGLTDHLKLL